MTDHNNPSNGKPIEMEIADRETAGRLLIGMALGEIPRPQTTEEALQLLKDHGVELKNFPGAVKDIRFVSRDEAVYIVLPPADLMRQRIEEYSSSPKRYPLPGEYALQVKEDPTALKALDMFYFRVGDYGFGQCR